MSLSNNRVTTSLNRKADQIPAENNISQHGQAGHILHEIVAAPGSQHVGVSHSFVCLSV